MEKCCSSRQWWYFAKEAPLGTPQVKLRNPRGSGGCFVQNWRRKLTSCRVVYTISKVYAIHTTCVSIGNCATSVYSYECTYVCMYICQSSCLLHNAYRGYWFQMWAGVFKEALLSCTASSCMCHCNPLGCMLIDSHPLTSCLSRARVGSACHNCLHVQL